MPCKEVKSQKYQTRKSPPFHAGDCKDLTQKGNDGDYLSKPDANGVYKWVKVNAGKNKTRKLPKGVKSYFIHDNGGRPFRVEVSGKNVEIYYGSPAKLPNGTSNYDTLDYSNLVKKLTVKEIYVGQSNCISAPNTCGAFGKGNTVLLHVSRNKYIFVGESIYEFTMDDEVDKYYSLIGNNDVPYPVLLGTKNVYFMLDREMIPREVFKVNMSNVEWADAYQYFYGFKDFETGEEINCGLKCRHMHRRKMKGIKIIRKRDI